MALTDDQWADAVATAVSRFHTGITTEAQMSDEIKAATSDWPTRSLSNAGLAFKISRSLSSLTGLIETIGPPDPDAGTIGAMAFDNQALAFYGPKTESGWGPGRPIDAGPPGPSIEMQVAGGFIQWRVVGEVAWNDLISVSDLTGAAGADGREVELQATATQIQWRYAGDPSWTDLIALSALKGADGREVQMQASATHIQWRYAGDPSWVDIIALSAITGAQGSAAWTPIIATISDGERRVQQIVDWTGGGGTKPPVGKYIGPTGLVDTAAEATDIRGAGGSGTGDVMGPASSVDGGLVAFDGSTGTKIKAGPGVGVASAGDLLRRSDGDARYRVAGDVPQSEVTGLTSALSAKADLVGGKVPLEQLPAMSGGGLEVGDILTTARDPGPKYLPANGSSYLRTAWPELSPLMPDGGNVPFTGWTSRSLPSPLDWVSVTYGNGLFVAVTYGSATAATSPDGITWTARTLPSSATWNSVTYGNGLFVAVASGGTTAATSPDGITWTARALPSSATWQSVTYGNGLFVAVSYGSATAATSPDGITWTTRIMPSSVGWYSITYGNGLFVAVAYSSATAATSPDGVTWTARNLPSSSTWISVTYGNGLFVAVASGGTTAATSPDGITWTARTLPSSSAWNSVTHGNGLFVAVAGGPSTAAATSPDGITWTARTLPSSVAWRSVTYGNGLFVAVSYGSATAATSNKLTDPTLFAVPRIPGDDLVKSYIKGEA